MSNENVNTDGDNFDTINMGEEESSEVLTESTPTSEDIVDPYYDNDDEFINLGGEEEDDTKGLDQDEEGGKTAQDNEAEDTKEDDTESEADKTSEKEEEPSKDDKKLADNEDSAIEVKVNGEVQKLSLDQIKAEHPEILEQLKSGISGQKEVQRRFTELDKEKKEFYSEKETVEKYIHTFGEHVKDGNILGGLQFFAEFAGLPPYVIKEQLVAAIRPEIEKRSMMSQEEINNQRLKEENEFLAQKNESDRSKWEREQTELQEQQKYAELQAQLTKIRETHNITEDEWENTLDALDAELPKDQPITKEMVRDRVLEQRESEQTSKMIGTAISSHQDKIDELGSDGLEEELQKVIKAVPDITEQELSEIVARAIEIREKENIESNLSKKVKPRKNAADKSDVEKLKQKLFDDDEF